VHGEDVGAARAQGTTSGSRFRPASFPSPLRRARAVDILCRAPFEKVTACLDGAGGSAAKCVSEVTAFDRCTEDF